MASKKKVVIKKKKISSKAAGSAGEPGPDRDPLNMHQVILDDVISGSRAAGQCYTVSYIADRNKVSNSTVYNHIRQMHREGVPVYKTPRGLVYSGHASLLDMAKTQLRMVNRINSVAIEANGVIQPIVAAWRASNHPERNVVVATANTVASLSHTFWTTTARNMYSIVDTF